MPILRRETRRFRRRAISSLILAIELFNRPQDTARTEAVLILLQHAFEMILKAAIYQQRRTIFGRGEQISYTFERCLGIARSDLGILNEGQAVTLRILDGLRDCASHNLVDLTEQTLYVHAQAAVTLFDEVLHSAFIERLADHIPSRILPISTEPPKDMVTFVDSEFSQIRGLLAPGRHRKAEARGLLRHLMVMEADLSGDGTQPTDRQVDSVLRNVQQGTAWQSLFPGVAGLRLDTQGEGLAVSIRFTRQQDAAPVRVLRPGEPGAEDATIVREVNLVDRYSMGLKRVAQNLALSEYDTLALIYHLGLRGDSACYWEFPMGKSSLFKRYSPLALERLEAAKLTVDMNEVRARYKVR